jgi:hypothetical protein
LPLLFARLVKLGTSSGAPLSVVFVAPVPGVPLYFLLPLPLLFARLVKQGPSSGVPLVLLHLPLLHARLLCMDTYVGFSFFLLRMLLFSTC